VYPQDTDAPGAGNQFQGGASDMYGVQRSTLENRESSHRSPIIKSALSTFRRWAELPKKKKKGYASEGEDSDGGGVALKQEQSRRIKEREWLNNNNQPWP